MPVGSRRMKVSDNRFSTWTIAELVTRQSADEPITSDERIAEIERRIDLAASPQMREDASVGRAIRELEDPLKPAYVVTFNLSHVTIEEDTGKMIGEGLTLHDALIAAGLLEEVTP
jgi:hypothetical protein